MTIQHRSDLLRIYRRNSMGCMLDALPILTTFSFSISAEKT